MVTVLLEGIPDTASNEVRFFWDYWLRLKGAERLPAGNLIDPLDFFPHLPQVFIVEGSRLDDLRVRLAGSVYRDLYGFEIAGKYITELIPFSNRRDLLGDYTSCLLERAPVFHAGRMTWRQRGAKVSYERILLPFGDGEDVDKILGYAQFFDSDGHKLFR